MSLSKGLSSKLWYTPRIESCIALKSEILRCVYCGERLLKNIVQT